MGSVFFKKQNNDNFQDGFEPSRFEIRFSNVAGLRRRRCSGIIVRSDSSSRSKTGSDIVESITYVSFNDIWLFSKKKKLNVITALVFV